jgi:hypothetical protein
MGIGKCICSALLAGLTAAVALGAGARRSPAGQAGTEGAWIKCVGAADGATAPAGAL